MKLFLLATLLLSSTLYAQDPIIEVTCQYSHYFVNEKEQVKDRSPVYKITKQASRADDLELMAGFLIDIGQISFQGSFSFSDVSEIGVNPVGSVYAEFINRLDQTGVTFGGAFPYRNGEQVRLFYKTPKFTHSNLSVNRIQVICSGQVLGEAI